VCCVLFFVTSHEENVYLDFGVLKVVAWGRWVLQIFCGLFLVIVQNNGENTSCLIHGEFQDAKLGCDKIY